ncbi:MAG: DUF3881 family protein [Fusobacteriaceae bacterium]|jgi:hypothetical protein|nr:DUF3881 family protein [Fusobacteriaceae bacterium]
MGRFADVGFGAATLEEFKKLVTTAYRSAKKYPAEGGSYAVYSDPSGAQLWIQFNMRNEVTGASPYFKGRSRRAVCLTNTVPRHMSEMDGAFHCWAAPSSEKNPFSGLYPFVFDVPDYRIMASFKFPRDCDIQLNGFAEKISCQAGEASPRGGSFSPSVRATGGGIDEGGEPQAYGIFSGGILQWERRTNQLTGQEFYWLFVETLGGAMDILVERKKLPEDPVAGGAFSGEFWLTGRIYGAPLISG